MEQSQNRERPVQEDDVNTVRTQERIFEETKPLNQKSLLENWFDEVMGPDNFEENHKEKLYRSAIFMQDRATPTPRYQCELSSTVISEITPLANILTGPGHLVHLIGPLQTYIYGL